MECDIIMKYKLKWLEEKHINYEQHKDIVLKLALEEYELDFAIRYTHELTKIESNALSLIENKLIIEDRMKMSEDII